MAPKRLSDDEKNEIVELYRQPEETTSTLASRYGVSSSTISRILKQNLSAGEYDALVQQKRTGSGKPSIVDSNLEFPTIRAKESSKSASEDSESKEDAKSEPKSTAQPITESDQSTASDTDVEGSSASAPQEWAPPKLKRDRSSASPQASSIAPGAKSQDDAEPSSISDRAELKDLSEAEDTSDSSSTPSRRRRRRSRPEDVEANGHQPATSELEATNEVEAASLDAAEEDSEGTAVEEVGFDAASYASYGDDDLDDALEDDLDDDLEDDFSDLDDEDEDGEDSDDLAPILPHHDLVQVFPFSDVELPRTCYLVIDRFAELIAPPLKDFGELGKIPEEELSAKTLPIFDNHRVAKRFANRKTQRIVKVPDGRMLQKTMPYLSAKGITRLLFDGQVYSLVD